MDKKAEILLQCYAEHMLLVFKSPEIAAEKARQYIALMDKDEYEAIHEAMETYANSRPKPLTAIELGKELFVIHSHAEFEAEINPEQIVYKEVDIINLLKRLGYPEPDWEGNAQEISKEQT